MTGTGAAAREFKVVVRLDRPDPGLRQGLTCDAEIVTSEGNNVLTVPLQSVVLRAGAPSWPDRSGVIGGLDIEVSGIDQGDQALREMKDGTLVKAAAKAR